MSRDPYDDVLDDRHAWLLGEVEPLVERELTTVAALGLAEGRSRLAIDLGCGTGLHTRMLLSLGYEVTAVDQDAEVLEELADLPVTLVHDDLVACLPVAERVGVVCCMGGALAHLQPSQVAVVLDAWRPGRELVLSFRDLTSVADGEELSMVTRQDVDRIHTCLLRGRADHVEVTDVIHERRSGDWGVVSRSWIERRLDVDAVVLDLKARGAEVAHRLTRGTHYLLAR